MYFNCVNKWQDSFFRCLRSLDSVILNPLINLRYTTAKIQAMIYMIVMPNHSQNLPSDVDRVLWIVKQFHHRRQQQVELVIQVTIKQLEGFQ